MRVGGVEGDAGATVAAGAGLGEVADFGGWVGGGRLFQDDHAGRLEEASFGEGGQGGVQNAGVGVGRVQEDQVDRTADAAEGGGNVGLMDSGAIFSSVLVVHWARLGSRLGQLDKLLSQSSADQ